VPALPMVSASPARLRSAQPWVGAGVRRLMLHVRVLHRMSPEAVPRNRGLADARFVDCPRARSVDVLAETTGFLLSGQRRSWKHLNRHQKCENCGAIEKKNFTASHLFRAG